MANESKEVGISGDDPVLRKEHGAVEPFEEKRARDSESASLASAQPEKPASISDSTESSEYESVAPPVAAITNPITRTISTLSRVSTNVPVTPFPDGGRSAWLQVLGVHLATATCWGTLMSWGVYQTYYTSTFLTQYPQSTISWIGSIQVTLVLSVGIVSGRLTDAGYFYPITYLGLALEVFATFMTSLGTQFWHLLLAQGICFGIGAGLAFTPLTALLSTYFEKNRALAIAVAASGTATGGLTFPMIIRQLLPKIGFAPTVRVVGIPVLIFNVTCAIIVRWRLPPHRAGSWLDVTALRDRTFVLALGGSFFVFWAVYFAFFYVGVFSHTVIGLSYEQSVNLLLVMVAIGVPSRIIPGIIADRILGPLTTLIPFVVLAAIMLLSWITVSNTAGLYVFSAVYGISGAAIQTLFPVLFASLAPDESTRGTRLGMGFFVASSASLSGPPIAGALITSRGGDFFAAQLWAGLSMLTGCSLLLFCRFRESALRVRLKL